MSCWRNTYLEVVVKGRSVTYMGAAQVVAAVVTRTQVEGVACLPVVELQQCSGEGVEY